METFNLGKYYKDGKLKDFNGWMFYSSHNNFSYCFYDEDLQIFSVFSGFDYELVNDACIQLCLNYIKEVLVNKDEEANKFIFN